MRILQTSFFSVILSSAFACGFDAEIIPSASGQQIGNPTMIHIRGPKGVEPDSVVDRSIDYEVRAGRGEDLVREWLERFREDGWTVRTVDEDLPEDGEYELRKGKLKLEVVFDDPGFGPADITVSCASGFRLNLTDDPAAAEKDTASPDKSAESTDRKMVTKLNEHRTVTETIIASAEGVNLFPGEDDIKQYWISPDCRTFASYDSASLLLRVNLSEVQLEQGFKPDSFVFDRDGRHYACIEMIEDGESLIVDGNEIIRAAQVASKVVFSPNGEHYACVIVPNQGDAKKTLFLDGNAIQTAEEISSEIGFTSNSDGLLFSVKSGDDWQMMLWKPSSAESAMLEHGPINGDTPFFYGPDHQIGYVARFSDHEYGVMYDGEEIGPRLLDIKPENVVVSRDGKHVAYVGDSSPVRNAVVHLGQRGTEYNVFEEGRIEDQSLALSPDGRRIAFIVKKDELSFVVIDGKSEQKYPTIQAPEFSPDGSHCAYLALKDGSPVVVVDGKESPKYAMAGMPEYSRNGKTIAWYAELSDQEFMVINGKPQKPFLSVTKPCISDDGTTVAYSALDGEFDSVIVNGKSIGRHEIAGQFRFFPETNRLIYFGLDEESRVYIDGQPGNVYDQLVPAMDDTNFVFDGPNTIRYMAVKDGRVLQVEETLTPHGK